MPYCPKCGEEIQEDMTFCPKCGAPLKISQIEARPTGTVTYRREREEKGEKREKEEKGEKHEKREHAFIGPLIGGMILIFIGLAAYLQMVMPERDRPLLGAVFFIVIGIVIIVGALYGAMLASRRNPRT